MSTRQVKDNTPRWSAGELQQQLLHQLNKDHINMETIQRLVKAAGGKKSVLPLLGSIASGTMPEETWYEQANAIYVLGMMKDPAAIPWLTDLLDDADADLQVLAVRALGRIGGDQALEPVRQLYNAPHPAPKQANAPPGASNSGAANGTSSANGTAKSAPCLTPPAVAQEMRQVLTEAEHDAPAPRHARHRATHD